MIQHVRAVWQFRHFWMALVRMDLRLRYRRSVLGIGWSMLNPLAMTAVFCVVFSNLMGNGDWRQTAPTVYAGMIIWEFLKGSALQGCAVFIRNECYVRQSPLPYGIYPLRTVLGTGIHFLISLAVVVAVSAALKGSADPVRMLWAVLPAVGLMAVFCWALATLFAFANVFFEDVQHLLEVVTTIMFFATPIMFPAKVLLDKGYWFLVELNPVVLFLDMIRLPLLDGQLPPVMVYAQATALTVVLVGLAVGTMAWLQKQVIFKL